MTEIKLTLEDPAEFARWANAHAGQMPPTWAARAGQLHSIAAQIEEQVKPSIEEPQEFGSVVRKVLRVGGEQRWCRTYSVAVDEPWCTGSHMGAWAEILEDAADVEVLRVGLGPEPLAEWESDLLNQQARRDIAAAVLSAMDVDQYLIDAVVNARPR